MSSVKSLKDVFGASKICCYLVGNVSLSLYVSVCKLLTGLDLVDYMNLHVHSFSVDKIKNKCRKTKINHFCICVKMFLSLRD